MSAPQSQTLTHFLPKISVTLSHKLSVPLVAGQPAPPEEAVITVDLTAVQRIAVDPPPGIDTTGSVQLPSGINMAVPPQPNQGINLYFSRGVLNSRDASTFRLTPVPESFVSLAPAVFDSVLPLEAKRSFPLVTYTTDKAVTGWLSLDTAYQCAGFMTVSNLACNTDGSATVWPGGTGTSACEWRSPGVMRFWSIPRVEGISVVARDLIDYFMRILTEKGYALNTVTAREIKRDLKEKLAYFVDDLDSKMQQASSSSDEQQNYELPDGQVVTIDDPRFQAPEVLETKPWLLGLDGDGYLRELPNDGANLSSDAELRQYLAEHPAIAVTFHPSYIRIMQPL
jgi:hypothetical protein